MYREKNLLNSRFWFCRDVTMLSGLRKFYRTKPNRSKPWARVKRALVRICLRWSSNWTRFKAVTPTLFNRIWYLTTIRHRSHVAGYRQWPCGLLGELTHHHSLTVFMNYSDFELRLSSFYLPHERWIVLKLIWCECRKPTLDPKHKCKFLVPDSDLDS